MFNDRYVRTWTTCIAVIVLVGPGGCGRAVGAGDHDSGVDPKDGATTADAGEEPDAGDLVENVLGWHSVGEEHSGFVAAADVDTDLLDACNPWLMAAGGGETWWTFGTSEEALLPLYPHPEHWERIGLGLITGYLSGPGVYGHMGMYDRELWITRWELQVCATVERVRHCAAPRKDDFCQVPEPLYNARRNHLVRILPGPMSDSDHYELTIYYDESVLDGETRFLLAFQLPQIIDPGGAAWAPIPVNDISELEITEERLWFGYQLIPYPHAHDGWVLRSTTSDILRLSLSAESDDGQPLHIWGDFPVDEIIGYP